MRTLITNAYLLDMVGETANIGKKDILINDNIIEKIDENIDTNDIDVKINAKNMLVMPGLINTHTHLAMSIFRGYKTDKKLMDWLENAIFPVEDKLKPEDIYWNSYLSCLEMIKSGTTTCNDMYLGMNKTIEALENTGLRAIVAWSIKDDSIKDKFEKTREFASRYNSDKNSKIKICVAADSPQTCNPDTIERCVNLAKELNTGLHIHFAESVDEERKIKSRYAKRSTEYLNDLNVFDVPVVLAHGVHITDSDIDVLKNIKGGISHNPISDFKLATGVCDVVKLRKNNINVGLGTDGIGNTSTMDMFEEMKTAGYMQKKSKLQPYDILKMATIEGAKVLGLDDQIGTIEEGKKADMIFLNTAKIHMCPENDICHNIVYSANGADVDTVIIDGNIIMQNRKMINVNEKEVIKQVKRIAKKLL